MTLLASSTRPLREDLAHDVRAPPGQPFPPPRSRLAIGHERQFLLLRLKARCRLGKATFATTDGNGRDAPKANVYRKFSQGCRSVRILQLGELAVSSFDLFIRCELPSRAPRFSPSTLLIIDF